MKQFSSLNNFLYELLMSLKKYSNICKDMIIVIIIMKDNFYFFLGMKTPNTFFSFSSVVKNFSHSSYKTKLFTFTLHCGTSA